MYFIIQRVRDTSCFCSMLSRVRMYALMSDTVYRSKRLSSGY